MKEYADDKPSLTSKERRFVAHNKTVGCQSVRAVAVLCKTSLSNSE